MKRIRVIGLVAVIALVLGACGEATPSTTTQSPDAIGGPAITPSGALSEYGETDQADAGLISRALGPVTPSDEASWNIVLASIARAHQDLNEATIAKAIECWSQQECQTGSGGELIMGYADGGGRNVNVWRAVSRMEAVLQALTYPEIGTIVTREAEFAHTFPPDFSPAVPIGDIQFLVDRGADFIVGYPDAGTALSDVIRQANTAGVPYFPFSAGWVGLPGQGNALTPGVDYPTVVGEDLCALGTSFAETLNDNVAGGGKVMLLGGSTDNALSLGWQRCTVSELSSDLTLVNPPAGPDSTTGDTFWFPPIIPDIITGLLSPEENRPVNGWAYEYADGFYYALPSFEALNLEWENVTLALRTDEQRMFCHWRDVNEPTYKIFYSAGGNFQSRIAVTAAILHLQDASIPAEIVVPHVMRQVTAADCDENRAHDEVSGTSLVPDDVLRRMFP